jgi:hypothetical protein
MIKIPILITDGKYYGLNLPNPPMEEEIEVMIYLNASMILGIGPWIEGLDVDYDSTQLMITNGSRFKLPMSVTEATVHFGFAQIKEDGVPLD